MGQACEWSGREWEMTSCRSSLARERRVRCKTAWGNGMRQYGWTTWGMESNDYACGNEGRQSMKWMRASAVVMCGVWSRETPVCGNWCPKASMRVRDIGFGAGYIDVRWTDMDRGWARLLLVRVGLAPRVGCAVERRQAVVLHAEGVEAAVRVSRAAGSGR